MAQFKLNTTVHFNQTILWIIEAMDYAHKMEGLDQSVVTSQLDGKHSDHSGHYYGRALDFRFVLSHDYIKESIKRHCEEWLSKHADGEYFILIERDHFHVQRQKNSF